MSQLDEKKSAPPRRRLLLIEDDLILRNGMERYLTRNGIQAVLAGSLAEAREVSRKESYDVVIVDQNLPDGSGIDLISDFTGDELPPKIIMMTGAGDVRLAVQALRLGAVDYLLKPLDMEELVQKVDHAFHHAEVERAAAFNRSSVARRGTYYALTPGSSEKAKELFRLIDLYSEASPTPVLVLGETGAGKERAARSLHAKSTRANAPFVAVNCASLDNALFESELFGHEKGAFTGAQDRKIGLMEIAHGGTLFLDEVGEIPPQFQAKLLRAIETRTFRRVGSTREGYSDFWLISATNRDLGPSASAQSFRPDLYYRISTLILRMPSLRERLSDIPDLVSQICQELLGRHSERVTFDDGVLDAFEGYSWPGNIRELRNVVERSLIVHKDLRIRLPEGFQTGAASFKNPQSSGREGVPAGQVLPLREAQRQAEREAIDRALRASGGNKSAAAKALEISLSTFKRLLKEHAID
ncbi:MAG: sigma-54 dependent transcriptional regulator [Bdellovibrionota bacterium]